MIHLPLFTPTRRHSSLHSTTRPNVSPIRGVMEFIDPSAPQFAKGQPTHPQFSTSAPGQYKVSTLKRYVAPVQTEVKSPPTAPRAVSPRMSYYEPFGSMDDDWDCDPRNPYSRVNLMAAASPSIGINITTGKIHNLGMTVHVSSSPQSELRSPFTLPRLLRNETATEVYTERRASVATALNTVAMQPRARSPPVRSSPETNSGTTPPSASSLAAMAYPRSLSPTERPTYGGGGGGYGHLPPARSTLPPPKRKGRRSP